MKRFLTVNQNSDAVHVGLLVARIGVAALMLTHGLPKLMMLFSGAPVQFPPVMGMSAELTLALAVFAEVICSLFIFVGFATRFATLPLIITMLAAVLLVHANDPFSVKEPALQYLLLYVVLLFSGSGKYSIDYFLQNKKATANYRGRNVQDPSVAIYQ